MSQKETPKSCSCSTCKHSKASNHGKAEMKANERAFRHKMKQLINTGSEDILPAGRSDRIG